MYHQANFVKVIFYETTFQRIVNWFKVITQVIHYEIDTCLNDRTYVLMYLQYEAIRFGNSTLAFRSGIFVPTQCKFSTQSLKFMQFY